MGCCKVLTWDYVFKEKEIVMVENIFKYAAQHKVRFKYNGWIATEDLYDLTTRQLDEIYKSLKREEKANEEESLLDNQSDENVELAVKIEIVKDIVKDKLQSIEDRNKAAEIREKKNKILDILARKQDEDLQSKSVEELVKMLEEL